MIQIQELNPYPSTLPSHPGLANHPWQATD